MSQLHINSLFAYGHQIYSTCASFRDKTLESCQQIAKRTWSEAKMYGQRLGYRIGNPKLLNMMVRLDTGLSIEEMKATELHVAASLGTTADINAILAKGADVNATDGIGCTPLHYAALRGNDTGCRSLLNKGANAAAKDIHGRTPLHAAAIKGNRAEILTLLKAGASHAAKTLRGDTPLHFAVRAENKETTRALVAAGADIHAMNLNKITTPTISDNIEINRILFDFESHPAFVSLTTLHDYCDQIFPASRDRLPKDWETWQKKLNKIKNEIDSFRELREVLAKCGPISNEKFLKTIETLQETYGSSPNLASIVLCLLQESPLFAKAWALVNRDEKLKLIKMSKAEFNKCNSSGFYGQNSHAIHIHKSSNIYDRTDTVIFEIINAVQRERFMRVTQLAELGELSREEYTLFKENLEYDTLYWNLQIQGRTLTNNFTEDWKKSEYA